LERARPLHTPVLVGVDRKATAQWGADAGKPWKRNPVTRERVMRRVCYRHSFTDALLSGLYEESGQMGFPTGVPAKNWGRRRWKNWNGGHRARYLGHSGFSSTKITLGNSIRAMGVVRNIAERASHKRFDGA